MSVKCVFDELGVDLWHLKIHNSAYLLNVILFLFLTYVPRLFFILSIRQGGLIGFQWIRILEGLSSELEIEHMSSKKGSDYLSLTKMGIRVIIHN